MASKVIEVASDLTSKKQKTLLMQIVKHALSLTINQEEYAKVLEAKAGSKDKRDLAELIKTKGFKRDLITHTYNQLIRGGFEHYVCLIGTQFMLQVKYRKTSMIKFDICGQTLMLYEVAYIAVPCLLQDAKITDKEVEKLDKTRIEEI